MMTAGAPYGAVRCALYLLQGMLLLLVMLLPLRADAFRLPDEIVRAGAPSGPPVMAADDAGMAPELPGAEHLQDVTVQPRKRWMKRTLLKQYARWRGTRYRLGGTTRRGVDCSALMQKVFRSAFHRALPRTAADQRRLGRRVSRQALRPGDLVFFHPRPGVRHVGVWLGDGQFMHASGRKGVTLSRLNSRFWLRHYDTARRLALN